MKSVLILIVALSSCFAWSAPRDLTDLTKFLRESSPCLLTAGFPVSSGKVDSTVICIRARFNARTSKMECVAEGYDTVADKFVALPVPGGKSLSSRMACEEGGIKELFAREVQAGFSLEDTLRTRASLLHSVGQKYLNLYFERDREGMDRYLARNRTRPPMLRPRGFGMAPVSAHESARPVLESMPGLESMVLESMDAPEEKGFTTVRVFYATDRAYVPNVAPAETFNGERSEGGVVTYGTADVSIPLTHQRGQIETASVFTLTFSSDPKKHILLQSVMRSEADTFFRDLKARVDRSAKKDAFVFVHGFNVRFEDGVRRTAQLAYDLDFQGAPILFSWPSGEKIHEYSMAEANAQWTHRHLQKFLIDVARKSGAERVHLIAHSMGNRPVTDSLANIGSMGLEPLFQQVLLTAPDVDASVFEQIAEAVKSTANRVTVYASDHDQALNVSKKFHGGYPRLGQANPSIFVSPFVDSVSAANCVTSALGLGHDYYGAAKGVLDDIQQLCANGCAPDARTTLLRKENYWILRD